MRTQIVALRHKHQLMVSCVNIQSPPWVLASSVSFITAWAPSVLTLSHVHAGITCRATAGRATSADLDTISKIQAWASWPLRRHLLLIAHPPSQHSLRCLLPPHLWTRLFLSRPALHLTHHHLLPWLELIQFSAPTIGQLLVSSSAVPQLFRLLDCCSLHGPAPWMWGVVALSSALQCLA